MCCSWTNEAADFTNMTCVGNCEFNRQYIETEGLELVKVRLRFGVFVHVKVDEEKLVPMTHYILGVQGPYSKGECSEGGSLSSSLSLLM